MISRKKAYLSERIRSMPSQRTAPRGSQCVSIELLKYSIFKLGKSRGKPPPGDLEHYCQPEEYAEIIIDLTHAAAAAQAVSHLKAHTVVPVLAIITVLLLILVIVFGPRDRGPRRDPDPSD